MTQKTDSKSVLFAGASALALTVFGPVAFAQEDAPDDARRLGTVTVTTQKIEQSIQDVPIAVSAFDEDALNKLQLAGGPDLVKSIPNVSFTAGNFGGANFKVRGIGVDVIATSGDAGVGVHQNDVPLTANRLFEAEFFDMERIEVLRGPQGTLYGRNATGGVFNAITAKPVLEEYQANATVTVGNYDSRKYKGMLNVPIGDKIAVRVAGSYLEREGYATNLVSGDPIDGRELYGVRGSVAYEPTDKLNLLFVAEHFEEDDNRLRVGKQLCEKDPVKTSFGAIPITGTDRNITSLGCVGGNTPLREMRDRVNTVGTSGGGLGIFVGLLTGDALPLPNFPDYRAIESAFDPKFYSEQTHYTWKAGYDLTDSLKLTYLGSYGETFSLTQEDYNKIAPSVPFNNVPGLFPGGVVPDPQLGASNVFRTYDSSGGESEQTTHEIRLQSSFDGRFNFNVGGILVDFEANQDFTNPEIGYYVFSNSLTAITLVNNALGGAIFCGTGSACATAIPAGPGRLVPIDTGAGGIPIFGGSVNGTGGNYFRSISPYTLESVAIFGESYVDVTDDLKFTLGLRYTDDKKEQLNIPTFLFTPVAALPGGNPLQVGPAAGATTNDEGADGSFNAAFQEVTGRAGFDWQPDLSFTEDTLLYAFYSRGYKGGGINPPLPADPVLRSGLSQFFDPEFVNSYEIGTKNTLADGALQFNATGFYYDYEGYQITQIVNRTSANFNIDAKIQGVEIEALWNPVSTLVLNTNVGLLNTEIGETWALDTLDRANGRSDLVVLKHPINYTNCVVSAQGYAAVLGAIAFNNANGGAVPGLPTTGQSAGLCLGAYAGAEAAFGLPTGNVVSFTRSDGTTGTVSLLTPFEGDAKSLDGNSIPGSPDSTINFGAEYTWLPGSFGNWAAVGRVDYYRQSESFSRVFNTRRDTLDSWENVNLSLALFNEENGMRIELFGKNVLDEEVITGSYLTSDDSGLFTNIFLTEPRTYGISLTKEW
jgi:outer membrane receptor protein involved in Fe transport